MVDPIANIFVKNRLLVVTVCILYLFTNYLGKVAWFGLARRRKYYIMLIKFTIRFFIKFQEFIVTLISLEIKRWFELIIASQRRKRYTIIINPFL